MTMAIELAKRDFITQAWEETRHDPASRKLLFGSVIDSIVKVPEETPDWDTVRADIEKALISDPPDKLRESVEKDLLMDPPQSLLDEVEEMLVDDPPDRLYDRVKGSVRESIADEYRDQIEGLLAEVRRLRERLGEKRPSKVWR